MLDIFKKFPNTTMMVIGDIMLDKYVYGKVTRISPEAPIPILEYEKQSYNLGGAANVAMNISSLKGKAILLGLLGDDAEAKVIESLCMSAGIEFTPVISSNPTIIKTRFVSHGQQLLRLDHEAQVGDQGLNTKSLISSINHTLKSRKIDGIILQDYNKGVLTQELISWIMEEAKNRKIPTYVDPKKDNFFEYKNATLVKPNLKESFESLSMPIVNDDKSLINVAEKLKSKLNADFIVITRSEKGILALENDGPLFIRNQPRSIADVCGAGDTVIATLSMCLSNGLDLKSSTFLANEAAGSVCEEFGVQPIQFDKLFQIANNLT
jgi:rfaE bifunctional protein kinase chain/domain